MCHFHLSVTFKEHSLILALGLMTPTSRSMSSLGIKKNGLTGFHPLGKNREDSVFYHSEQLIRITEISLEEQAQNLPDPQV